MAGRYFSEYQDGPDGLLVPGRFEEYLYDLEQRETATFLKDRFPAAKEIPDEEIQKLAFESEATYSNYRKFSTSVKILQVE